MYLVNRLFIATAALLLFACSSAGSNRAWSSPSQGGESLEDVFERVQSSVVTIRTVSTTGLKDSRGTDVSWAEIGSGVLISEDGKIMTAAHVVQTADRVTVEFMDGTKLPARVLSSVPAADLALVQLMEPTPATAHVARLGNSDLVRIGARVFVVGAPLGISHTLTVGHVSARRTTEASLAGIVRLEQFQTDAAINKGNSGGPMFDMRGEVIGIVSFIVSSTGGSEGLGFAVTSRVGRELLLERNAMWSGVDMIVLRGALAAAFNLPKGRAGALIQHVAKSSPGERLGLRGGTIEAEIQGQKLLLGGDIVLEVFGVPFGDPKNEAKIVRESFDLEPDEIVRLVILREGNRITIEKTVREITGGGETSGDATMKGSGKGSGSRR